MPPRAPRSLSQRCVAEGAAGACVACACRYTCGLARISSRVRAVPDCQPAYSAPISRLVGFNGVIAVANWVAAAALARANGTRYFIAACAASVPAHKRAVELPLARPAPKARGLTAKSCPGPSPLRRQALRITKMRGIASIAMPVRAVLRPPDRDGGGLGRLRPQLALIVPLAQRHTLHPQDVVGGDGVEM